MQHPSVCSYPNPDGCDHDRNPRDMDRHNDYSNSDGCYLDCDGYDDYRPAAIMILIDATAIVMDALSIRIEAIMILIGAIVIVIHAIPILIEAIPSLVDAIAIVTDALSILIACLIEWYLVS